MKRNPTQTRQGVTCSSGRAAIHRSGLGPTVCGLGLVCLLATTRVMAGEPGDGQELILFGSAEAYRVDPEWEEAFNDEVATADIFYSITQSRFRLLAELLVSTDEIDLERLQVGWLPDEATWIFVGRYHQPSNFWGSVYHHGQYLQTPITRPAIEDWEDDGGVLQAHQTGLMVESNFGLGDTAGFEVAVSFGTGLEIGDGVLEPYNILDPDDRAGTSVAARVGFMPDALGTDSLGVVVAKNQMRSTDAQVFIPDLAEVNQTVVGVFANWTWGTVQLVSAAYRVRNDMQRISTEESDTFTASYVQVEKSVSDWTVYGRWENTANEESSQYLTLFPDFVFQRSLAGVRLDFRKRHALTLEIAEAENRMGDYRKIAIQWSAAFR